MALTSVKAHNQKIAWNVLENMFINQDVSWAHPSWTLWYETKPNVIFPLLFRQEYTFETSGLTSQLTKYIVS